MLLLFVVKKVLDNCNREYIFRNKNSENVGFYVYFIIDNIIVNLL